MPLTVKHAVQLAVGVDADAAGADVATQGSRLWATVDAGGTERSQLLPQGCERRPFGL